MGVTTAAVSARPRWYVDALKVHVETVRSDLDGCPIAVRSWGSPGDPVAVLVHGAAAHSRWWDHVAPLLCQGYHVLAPDLSGHGDSGWQPSYSLNRWAREVLHVAAEVGRSTEPAMLVGHSLGGWVAATAAQLAPSAVAGTITIDSSIVDPTPERDAARQRRAMAPVRTYPTREVALGRFRLLPEHDGVQDYIAEHIAEHSVRLYDGGWSWKFDPGVFARHRPDSALFASLQGRLAMLRAEHGLAADDESLRIYEGLRRTALVVDLPDSGHHAMLDHPMALVTALRAVLGAWHASDTSKNPALVATTAAGVQPRES